MEVKTCKIYTLEHPITGEVRYIGKTEQSLSTRLTKHIHACKGSKTHRNNWIQSLLNQELRPIINLLEEVEVENWQLHERYWIAQFKTWGFNLTNGTEGGDSVHRKGGTFEERFGIERAKEIKEKQRNSQLKLYKAGYVNPTKGKPSPLLGKSRSEEAIANFVKANKGRKNTIESKRNISAGKLGNRVIWELTKDGKFEKEFTNIYDIVSLYGYRRQSILDNLCGKRKSYKGKVFIYKEKS